jgi:phosphoribosylformylglycinamidine cyclo-ligase
MIVGVVGKKQIIDGKKVKAGDSLIALPSTGLHTNGYSLARTVLFEKYECDDFVNELGTRVGDALLAVHRSYLSSISAISAVPGLHALAHITGGGIIGNTSRVLPKGLIIKIDWNRWERPPIFQLIQRSGHVPEHDMRRTFNLGVGLIIIASKKATDKIISVLQKKGEHPFVIGEITQS